MAYDPATGQPMQQQPVFVNYQQPQAAYYQPPPRTGKDPTIALILELIPGFLFQTFGIGNIYAGNVGLGIGLLIGYWVLVAINFVLCFVFIGFITWPLTWILFMILCPLLAYNAAKKTQMT